MEQLYEHALKRQQSRFDEELAKRDALMADMAARLDALALAAASRPLVQAPGPTLGPAPVPGPGAAGAVHTTNIGTLTQIDARVTNNIHVNVVGFGRENRIRVPVAQVRAAFTENPRLVEYCRMSDSERVDAEKAAPFVLEALLDLVRRAHKDPIYRNIYLSPRRADQVMVCLDEPEDGPASEDGAARRAQAPRWEIRSLMEAIRLLFDGVAANIHEIIITDQERAQLPFDVQSAASWVPNLYEDEPDRFVRDGKAPMAAHLTNTRPDARLSAARPAFDITSLVVSK